MISNAAHSVGTNVSNNIGDLLGLSEERPKSASAEQPQPAGTNSSTVQHMAEQAQGHQGRECLDAVGGYLAALSLAASDSTEAPALVKHLDTSALRPRLSAGRPFCDQFIHQDQQSDSFQCLVHPRPPRKASSPAVLVQVAQKVLGLPWAVHTAQ